MKTYGSPSYSRVALFLLAASLLVLPCIVQAQDVDPPSRVARLNFIEGSVSFQPAGESEWLAANPNRPLTTGDQLWADQGSRGELHLGGAVLRLSSETAVSFLNLTDDAVQIQVAQGSASLRVRQLEDNESYEIDTPNLAFSILRPGKYRVDVSADGNTSTVYVEGGAAEVTAGGQAYNAGPGQQYTFSGTDQVSYDEQPLPQPDNFEEWAVERDRREDRFASAQYVSPDVIGYEDLDDHGAWRDDREYGHVWVPNGVAADWAPYRYGHWAYVAPWGWTWVEDEPWGFAPFHYGRWRRSDRGVDRTWRPCRSGSGVVSFRPAGRLGAFLPRERGVCVTGKRDEFAGDQSDGDRECLQHHGGESDDCREPHIHVREFAARCDRCLEEYLPEW